MNYSNHTVSAFAPLIGVQAHTLILGSIPGAASLQAQQYYAHPRNAFWYIMAHIVGFDAAADYPQRCYALTDAGFALWDVLAGCMRKGSLDSAIERKSERPNPIHKLLNTHPDIHRIACNGTKAWQCLHQYMGKALPADIQCIRLPSTSPAHARQSNVEKLAIWHAALWPYPSYNSQSSLKQI